MKLRELTLNEMAATGGGASPGGPSGPSGPPSSPPSATVPTLASTARVGARPPGGGHGLSQQGDLAVGKGGIFLGHQQAQEPHNYDADAQVGQGLEWPKAAGASETTNVKRDEVEMPGEHHVAHHGDTHDGHGVSESTLREFAPGGSDDGDADPYRYPKPESYSRSADFFGRFEADHFDHEDFDDVTGVFKGYWDSTQIAYFKFDNPAKASGDDPGMGWYYEPDADITNDNTPAKPAVDTSAQRKQQELGMIDAFLKSGQTAKPGSQIHGLMKKHGMAEGSMNEFALPGGNDGDSGRWYTDDELADIIGDDWFQDFDVSHDEFNIDAYGEKAKKNLAGYANTWFDDKGYNVNVMGVDHNEVDHDLKWYIVGSFQNDNFANKDVEESRVMEDGEATVSADIATVAYPMTRGRTRREKRRNARRAVGQSFTAGPPGVGTGVFEASLATMRDYFAGNDDAKDTTKLATMRDYFTSIDKNIPDTIQRILWKVKNNVSLQPLEYSQYKTWMQNRRNTKIAKEAHVLGHQNVIYRLDKDKPMTDTEVLVLGGAGRYTLGGLRDKARREADAMAADLKVEHGGSFRRASNNIKQLTNTLNTIVAAYNELKRIRSKGGRGSRGITDEESNFMRECTQRMNALELYTHRVRQARRIVEGIHRYLAEDKMSHEQASIIKGMFHLNTDPGYGFYRYAIHVAGNQGGDKVVLGPNAGPFAYAYTPEEEKMIKDAVKAITGKEPLELTGGKSKEPDFVNKNSTVPSIDWKKVK